MSNHICGKCIHACKGEDTVYTDNKADLLEVIIIDDCKLGYKPRKNCWFYEEVITDTPTFEQHEKNEDVKLRRKSYVKNDV